MRTFQTGLKYMAVLIGTYLVTKNATGAGRLIDATANGAYKIGVRLVRVLQGR